MPAQQMRYLPFRYLTLKKKKEGARMHSQAHPHTHSGTCIFKDVGFHTSICWKPVWVWLVFPPSKCRSASAPCWATPVLKALLPSSLIFFYFFYHCEVVNQWKQMTTSLEGKKITCATWKRGPLGSHIWLQFCSCQVKTEWVDTHCTKKRH